MFLMWLPVLMEIWCLVPLLQVVVVNLEHNLITTTEDIPPIPEPEYSALRGEIMKLLHPNVFGIDHMKSSSFAEHYLGVGNRMWGEDHDLHLRWFLVASVNYDVIGVLMYNVFILTESGLVTCLVLHTVYMSVFPFLYYNLFLLEDFENCGF